VVRANPLAGTIGGPCGPVAFHEGQDNTWSIDVLRRLLHKRISDRRINVPIPRILLPEDNELFV
jgi:hypothetical protein